MIKYLPYGAIQAVSSICKNAIDNPNLKMTSTLRRRVQAQNEALRRLANTKSSLASRRKQLVEAVAISSPTITSRGRGKKRGDGQQTGGALPLLPMLYSLIPPVASFLGNLITTK